MTAATAILHGVSRHRLPPQVFLQYSGVSAWVPASFAVPTLIPKISLKAIKEFSFRKKKVANDDKQFRQVRGHPHLLTRPRLSLLILVCLRLLFAVLLTYTSALVGANAFLNLINLLTCSVLAADPVWHHGLLPAGRGAGLHGPQRQRQDQPADHHRRPRAEVGRLRLPEICPLYRLLLGAPLSCAAVSQKLHRHVIVLRRMLSCLLPAF